MTVIFSCEQCDGTGQIPQADGKPLPCPKCRGRGYLESTEIETPSRAQKDLPEKCQWPTQLER